MATDRKMACSAAWHMPYARRTRSAYRVCAHDLMTSRTWPDADGPFVVVTPRILRDVTRAISVVGGGGSIWRLRLGSEKTTSFDLFRFSVRLFVRARRRLKHLSWRSMWIILCTIERRMAVSCKKIASWSVQIFGLSSWLSTRSSTATRRTLSTAAWLQDSCIRFADSP